MKNNFSKFMKWVPVFGLLIAIFSAGALGSRVDVVRTVYQLPPDCKTTALYVRKEQRKTYDKLYDTLEGKDDAEVRSAKKFIENENRFIEDEDLETLENKYCRR